MRARRVFALVLMGITAGPLVHAQQVPDKPLGDVAREQRQARKLKSNKDPQKIYTNEDGAPPKATAESAEAKTPSLGGTNAKPSEAHNSGLQPVPAAATSEGATQSSNSITDRPKDEDTTADSLIIPAGTQIRVEVLSAPYGPFPPEEGTVSASVYVGSSMGIPARSKVRLSSAHPADGTYSPDGSAYVWVAVTAVTLDGATYKVHTNALPLSTSRATKELTFTLSKSLTIP